MEVTSWPSDKLLDVSLVQFTDALHLLPGVQVIAISFDLQYTQPLLYLYLCNSLEPSLVLVQFALCNVSARRTVQFAARCAIHSCSLQRNAFDPQFEHFVQFTELESDAGAIFATLHSRAMRALKFVTSGYIG